MKEKMYCIFDKSEKYAMRLADYINSRHLMPGHVNVYTSENALVRDADRYEVVLLMLVNNVDNEVLENVRPQITVYLTDEIRDKNYVNPYQSADHLVKEIMSYMSGIEGIKNSSNRKCTINSVYSPAGKCFKTTISLMLALWSSRNCRSLYINLEQFSGLGKILSDKEGGLSEALYHFKINGKHSIGKVISCSGQIQGMDYFYPVTCAEDISELQEQEFMEFLNLIAESGVYNYIWIDIGTVYNRPWRLMEICDRIIMPEAKDYMGQQKVTEMENYLVASKRTELLERIEKISMPYIEDAWNREISLEYLNQPGNGKFINKILEGNGCERDII